MSLRTLLAKVAENDDLITIERAVDPHFELANVAHALEGSLVLFTAVKGHAGWRVLSGQCADRRFFGLDLNIPLSELVHHLANAVANPALPPVVPAGACQEVIMRDVDLNILPIPLHLPQDAGHYIASDVVHHQGPRVGPQHVLPSPAAPGRQATSRRASSRIAARTRRCRKSEGDLPVAICIGVSQAVHLAASMSPPPGVDELSVAQALAPTPLVKCLTNDLEVPADAEIVLEGRITHGRVAEGPFMDLTETMDIVRDQPVIEIDLITHRRDPIFHALLPGGLEHKLLMGMPREPTIFAEVNKVTRCTGVSITPGGASWLHAVVQIDKQGAEDGRLAIDAAFRGHGSLKHVWVVDTDIDIHNPLEVEWALATRFQADEDLVILERTNPAVRWILPESTSPGRRAAPPSWVLTAPFPGARTAAKFLKGHLWRRRLADYLPISTSRHAFEIANRNPEQHHGIRPSGG